VSRGGKPTAIMEARAGCFGAVSAPFQRRSARCLPWLAHVTEGRRMPGA